MNSFLLSGTGDSGENIKALVVDTDPRNAHELGVALRARGCEPLVATTFEAAKKIWIAEKPRILIADVRLGQFNGLQLLLRAKADRPDVAAAITCTFPDKVLEAETQRFGGTFFVKPVRPEEVLAILLGPEERRAEDRRRNPMPEVVPERRHLGDRRRPTGH